MRAARWRAVWLCCAAGLLSACAAAAQVSPQTPYPPRPVRAITLSATDGTRLIATLYTPTRSPAPAVLLLHVANGSRHDWEPFAERLREAGIASLALDFRGHGASAGRRDWERMAGDAASALAFMHREPVIDRERIGVIGASLGANVALALGATEPAVRGVAMVSPGLSMYGYLALSDAQVYGARPLFMLSAEGDLYSAETQYQVAALARGSAQSRILPGAAHGTALLKDAAAAEVLMAWIESVIAR